MNDSTGTTSTLRQILWDQPLPAGADDPEVGESEDGPLEAQLEGLPPTLRTFAGEQIVALAATVLDRRLIDLFQSGWQRWEQLVEAARRTLEDPGEVGIVELDDHEISWAHRPVIEVTYGRRKITDIDVEAALDIQVHAATAVVSGGRLTALRTGRADLHARLSIQGQPLAETRREIDLTIELPLGDGIALIERPGSVTTLSDTAALALGPG